MTIQEQQYIKQTGYALAMRYMDNAKDTLKKAGRDGRYFNDSKYVSSASGIAYRGVLEALDVWLRLKGVEVPDSVANNKKNKERSKTIRFYKDNVSKLDKKLLKDVNGVYESLHLYGYYDATLLTKTIDEGFEIAKDIIERIKPREVA